ncbi:zinc finger protein 28 [Culex quinquefasciatus]|uniref:Zinc finger protein 28 n=1 Tax=Culex quinquefasciatus TaxID=7176 RepID=B0WZG6_CULQU|nr:zinc finger protein 28 [Culex quinquefasciatus]|eukprot:XP_001862788.1 zinc finger protein 28 [Culex quinquefasciatus]
MKSTLEDSQNHPESKETASFCYETVVKEEVILEDECVPSEVESEEQLPSGSEEDPNKKIMVCEECNKSYTNRELFRSHKYKHRMLKEGKFTCKICDKRFRDKYALTIHLQGIHLVSKLIKPVSSKKGDLNEPDVKQFPKTITNENGQFKCTECDEKFEFLYLQQRHIRRHTALKQELYKCEECNKAFASNPEFLSHMKRVHEQYAKKALQVSVKEEDGVFICSKCNKTFEERHLCQQHILKHLLVTKERTVSCPKCPKTFISEKYLVKHEAWHEASIKKLSEVIKCDECNKTFKTKRILSRHLRRHATMKEGKYQCKICSMRHASDRELKIHTKKHEMNVEMPSVPPPVIIVRNDHSAFQCPECGMVFTVRRAYNNHAQRHINIRNGMYKCNICEKMAEITVKTEPDYEMHSTLEDQQTQQEGSEDMTSFCYETVVKEEVILEDEFISPEEESARECNKAFATENKSHIKRAHEKHAQKSSEVSVLEGDGVFICIFRVTQIARTTRAKT